MIAALDATPLTLTSGGLVRYVTELSLTLAREFPADTFALLSDQKFVPPAGAPPNLVCGPTGNFSKHWWLHGVRQAISATRAELFHGTNFEVPYLGRTPSLLTIHDLSPWRDPAWHANAGRVRTRTPWLVRLRRARRIVTVSEAMKREIVAHFGVAPDIVHAIPLAASDLFRPAAAPPPATPYFLFIGTLEPRKNLAALVEAWRETRTDTRAELWIAGRMRADFVPIPSAEGIRFLGEVADRALPELLSGALGFVYPTLYEGFGLPVLEAMQCGCPVITSRDPAVTEVSGGAAIHAASTRDIADALRALAASEPRRNQLRQAGLERARQFSWRRTARETHSVYKELLAGAAST